MQLVIYCENCSKRNRLKIKASNRGAIKMNYGDRILVTCKRCGKRIRYEVRDIKAESRSSSLILILITITLIGLIFYLLQDYIIHKSSSRLLLPVCMAAVLYFYTTANKEINDKVKFFNKS